MLLGAKGYRFRVRVSEGQGQGQGQGHEVTAALGFPGLGYPVLGYTRSPVRSENGGEVRPPAEWY